MHGTTVALERSMPCPLLCDERGATTFEYLVVAGVVLMLVVGAHGILSGGVENTARCLVSRVVQGDAACSPRGSERRSVPPPPEWRRSTEDDPNAAENPDRRDTGRDARHDRRNRGRGDTEQPEGTSGDPAPPSSLGEPVAGESVPHPEPPPWKPVDPGAGEHDSEGASLKDYATEVAAEAGANALAGPWPDASRNLLHFLGNSGKPLEQDVNGMLDDIPEFAAQTGQDQADLGLTAIEEAKRRGATGPITFPVNTPWQGYGYDPDTGATSYDNENWFYALGGWQYNLTGEVTVYPPTTPGGAWRYEVATRVNIRDQYNWDGGKGVTIGPLSVSDEQLAELHRAGLAQEFVAVGASDVRTKEGSE
jgi:Flp pilus assembly pilin Flp